MGLSVLCAKAVLPLAVATLMQLPVRGGCEVTTSDSQLVQDALRLDVVDAEVREVALNKLHPTTWLKTGSKIAGLAGVCAATAYAPLLVLGQLGFGATGVAAGSVAASAQGAAIGTGTWFAWAQSTAATGAGFWKLGMMSSMATYLGVGQGDQSPGEISDKELLTAVIKEGKFDNEMRHLLRSKLFSKGTGRWIRAN